MLAGLKITMSKLDEQYGELLEEEVVPLRDDSNVEEMELGRAQQI